MAADFVAKAMSEMVGWLRPGPRRMILLHPCTGKAASKIGME
ncbi:hypothetical protein [Acidisoma sp. C75]